MIILPDHNIPRAKLLMPVPLREWRAPSLSLPRDQLGNEGVRTRFRLTARLHDGQIAWRGWFDDRDDADAFLFALVSGSLRYERELWRLPTPEWHPGLAELPHQFATQTILTTTGSNQTYTSPSDWNNSDNTVECLGGGASAAVTGGAAHATGGGGGAYSAITNFSFATPGTTTATYRVGAGAGVNTSYPSNGSGGSASWFNSSTDPGTGTDNTKCGAKGGSAGVQGTGSRSGGAGGSTSGWGQTKYAGGRGGNLTGASGRGGSGGGGAAGPAGAGGNGVDSSSTGSAVTTNGGTANNGTTAGGVANFGTGGDGGNGTEWTTHGCGSGGAGASASSSSAVAGDGGSYGGGGGGGAGGADPRQGGAGIQGLVIVTYTPSASVSLANINLAMMGM